MITFAPAPASPLILGIITPQCTCRGFAEAATSLSSQLGQCLPQQKAASMENPQGLSTELMRCHARRRWLAIFCFVSFQLQLLWDHWKSACCLVHTWLTKTLGCSFTRVHETTATFQGKWPLQHYLKMLTGREESSCSQDQGNAHPHAFFSDISKQERPTFHHS